MVDAKYLLFEKKHKQDFVQLYPVFVPYKGHRKPSGCEHIAKNKFQMFAENFTDFDANSSIN